MVTGNNNTWGYSWRLFVLGFRLYVTPVVILGRENWVVYMTLRVCLVYCLDT